MPMCTSYDVMITLNERHGAVCRVTNLRFQELQAVRRQGRLMHRKQERQGTIFTLPALLGYAVQLYCSRSSTGGSYRTCWSCRYVRRSCADNARIRMTHAFFWLDLIIRPLARVLNILNEAYIYRSGGRSTGRSMGRIRRIYTDPMLGHVLQRTHTR